MRIRARHGTDFRLQIQLYQPPTTRRALRIFDKYKSTTPYELVINLKNSQE
jgi:hypothetical protein